MTCNAKLALLLALLPVSALAQEQGDPKAGEAYARSACAECHAVGGGEEYSANLAAKPFREIMARPEMSAMAVAAWLQSDHENMPHIVPKPEEMNDVIAYMVSLKD